MPKLQNDITRCNGVSYKKKGHELRWREDCEKCLRRIAPRPDSYVVMNPPSAIVFKCIYVIKEQTK